MDLMQIRRGLLAQMAQSGADFVKGKLTIAADATGTAVFPFGKTFEKYMFMVEMTDESKTTLIGSTSLLGSRGYCFAGIYPGTGINSLTDTSTLIYTYAASAGTNSRTAGSVNIGGTGSQLGIPIAALTTNSSARVYQGMEYSVYIVEIK